MPVEPVAVAHREEPISKTRFFKRIRLLLEVLRADDGGVLVDLRGLVWLASSLGFHGEHEDTPLVRLLFRSDGFANNIYFRDLFFPLQLLFARSKLSAELWESGLPAFVDLNCLLDFSETFDRRQRWQAHAVLEATACLFLLLKAN